MKYRHFKNAIESEYKKSLKDLMYEVCVVKNLNAVEGSKKIGIAKEVFVYWRHFYRLEARQRLFDQTINELNKSFFNATNEKKISEC
ncbi:hypothetical protein ACQKDD_17345 [Planococcus kocurii]|uniref:hypothetical protein n=1 Tax=Planococcus TaxID=1372 RepID=UPI0011ED7B24|nr:hypothetical protein [Planococcus sp. ANT_H30]KAA0956397.1 hypothetical protein FQ085_12895 [Planococcus sp. ANT_H30]